MQVTYITVGDIIFVHELMFIIAVARDLHVSEVVLEGDLVNGLVAWKVN